MDLILNVDDHEAGRYAKSRWLKQAGFEVTEAGTGSRTLELAETLRPSLVMLDVNLPDISGLEVCRRIKSKPHLSSTAVLQISASAIESADQIKGLNNGADAYLVEPVDPEVLVATVRALLRMRNAEAALAAANQALVAANDRLVQTNMDLETFAHAASHDLKEPLRTISCFVSLFERQNRGKFDAASAAMLLDIQKAASRMGLLIDGLLNYAQATQLNEDDWGPVDLKMVVSQAVKNLERSIEESGAKVTCGPLPTVRGNEASLTQLFQNLIHNGLKYRKPGEGASITVTGVARPPGVLDIAVTDSGIGIAAQDLRAIFTPFRRLHQTAATGFGIGLATCHRIAERHGGRIWAESAGLGKGSTFHVSLPLDSSDTLGREYATASLQR